MVFEGNIKSLLPIKSNEEGKNEDQDDLLGLGLEEVFEVTEI